MTKIIFLSCFIFLISGCVSHQANRVSFSPLFDFSTVSSYSTYERSSSFSDWQAISDSMRNSIEIAIEKSMDYMGFHYQSPKNADVIVTYYLVGKNGKSLKRYNRGVNYCAYCLTSQHAVKADKYLMTPGNLILDIVDTKSNKTIWRTSRSLDIKMKDNSREVQAKIEDAVIVMLGEFTPLIESAKS